jgi:hypothetical protein
VIAFLSTVLVAAGVLGLALAVVGILMYPGWPAPCFVGAVATLTMSVGGVLGNTSFVSVVVAVSAYLVAVAWLFTWEWLQAKRAHKSTTDI